MQKNSTLFKLLITAFLASPALSDAQVVPNPYPVGTTLNYVRTWDARIPITDAATINTRPVTEVLQTTGYVDGLGRPLQTVVKQGSLATATGTNYDMVSPAIYDALGRETAKYLPVVANTGDGNFKYDPFQQQYNFYVYQQLAGQGDYYFYSNSDVEASPLNRVTKSYAPGNSWVGSGRGVGMNYLNNTTADDVKIWTVNASGNYTIGSSAYADGLLTEMHTTDELGHQVVEYKDKEGKVLLKKVQVGETATLGDSYFGWLCTYYVYDIYSNLRLVIPPKAVAQLGGTTGSNGNGWTLNATILNELCFRYEYDDKNRMIIKKVPGAAEVYIVYDKWDRLVLTQDGNLRSSNKWVFTKYDYLNRPIITGFYTDATYTTQAAMQSYVSSLMPASGPATFESTTGSGIGYTTAASFPALSSPQLLTISFYDNYNWATGSSYGSFVAKDNTNDGMFYSSGSPLYAQPLTASSKIKGMVTGTVTYILNSSTGQKLVSSTFYDDRGRAIQSRADNISGGTDITTTQYNFSGQPLMSLLLHQKTATSASIKVITKMGYDALGRLLQVKKQVLQIGGVQTAEKIISQNEYDALGQLKIKTLAPEFNSNAGLEKLNYEYNVRGWLLGVNRDFVSSTTPPSGAGGPYFGFELGYDKPTAAVSGTSYNNPQYNGNIEGTIWKSRGDNEKRKYDFTYDNANRLLAADFNQYTGGSFNRNANVDFSIKMGDGIDYKKAYDENGNILQMQQYGLKINASGPIDNLHYTYYNGGNKLKSVIDFNDLATTKLGDFRTSANHTQYSTKSTITTDVAFASSGNNIFDYGYDVNGNMITDRNKDLSGSVDIDQTSGGAITYNHLNLPGVITVAGKGNITYTYDAAGNKLQKTTVENNVTVTYNGTAYPNITVTTTTDYDAGLVYESKSYNNSTVNAGMGYTNKLQFTGHEEGRIRAVYNNTTAPNTITGFAYDYMVKDHLGNVRMVLTDELKQDIYPAATLEPSLVATENTFYTIDQSKIIPKSSITGMTNINYQNNNGITNNNLSCGTGSLCTTDYSQNMYQLNSNSNKTGLGITLKVMAGDKIDVFGKSYYFQNNPGSSYNNNVPVADLLAAFLNAPNAAAATSIHGGVTVNDINTSTGITGINSMMTEQNNQSNTNTSKPKAFINIIFFDEQFKAVDYRVSMVGGNGNSQIYSHYDLQNLSVPKNGFVYIYCSNESPVNVFFDNIQVVHNRGAILEETHYYPFGLTMVGISSKAAGCIENKKKYNGKELQNNEFSDGSGLEWLDYGARMYDEQLGKWGVIDPKCNKYQSLTPYNYCLNNPLKYIDPNGQDVYIAVWYSVDGFGHTAFAVDNYKTEKYTEKERYKGKDHKWHTKTVEKERQVADGTVTVYDFWPSSQVGKNSADENQSGKVNKYENISKDDFLNKDIKLGEHKAAEGVFQFFADKESTDKARNSGDQKYKDQNLQYNAMGNNCSDFAVNLLEQAVKVPYPNEFGKELISTMGNQYLLFKAYLGFCTTPNFVSTYCASFIVGWGPNVGAILKEDSGKASHDFVNAATGGIATDTTPGF